MRNIASLLTKQFFLSLLSITSLCAITPTVNFRSQGRDAARKIVGTVGHAHTWDYDRWYGMFSITPEYTHSFASRQITECLFGTNNNNVLCNTSGNECNAAQTACSNAIRIQGSRYDAQAICIPEVPRDPRAWLADYFYLPPDFNAFILFHPDISNTLAEFDLYIGFNSWCDRFKGFYVRFYGPIVHTKWNLDYCEEIFQPAATLGYPEGYFTPDQLANSNLLQTLGQYLQGQAPTIPSDQNIIAQPLRYAKICPNARTKNGFAELRAELGWDFINCDDYHLGINFQCALPTGSQRLAEFAFDPVVGNGKHWEAGVGATGHYILWRDCDEVESLGFFFDLNFTHRFARTEQRTFDLHGKPNSRYMLAERFGTPIENNLEGNGVAPTYQFKREFAPVANLSTFCLDVKIPLVADCAFMFNYTNCNFSVDFGYNLWARSCEKFSCDTLNDPFICNDSRWALKGDGRVFGYLPTGFSNVDCVVSAMNVVPANCDAIALSATQSQATICNGQNKSCDLTNPNTAIDNPALATTYDATPLMINRTDIAQINTSVEPIIISLSDIDFQATKGLSHKVFVHFSYNWWDCGCDCISPYLGIGGYAEFGKNESCHSDWCPLPCPQDESGSITYKTICTSDCKNCEYCSLSQWGIWIKGGFSFD